jgi:hypothetical protein
MILINNNEKNYKKTNNKHTQQQKTQKNTHKSVTIGHPVRCPRS